MLTLVSDLYVPSTFAAFAAFVVFLGLEVAMLPLLCRYLVLKQKQRNRVGRTITKNWRELTFWTLGSMVLGLVCGLVGLGHANGHFESGAAAAEVMGCIVVFLGILLAFYDAD